jgi:hypothetical protein
MHIAVTNLQQQPLRTALPSALAAATLFSVMKRNIVDAVRR